MNCELLCLVCILFLQFPFVCLFNMGRHKYKKRSRSSSNSSSSESDGKKIRKDLKHKKRRIEALEGLIRELRKSRSYGRSQSPSARSPSLAVEVVPREPPNVNATAQPIVRYVGRSDFILEFNPQTTLVPVEHWIRNLESTAKMHGWDERTLICNCTSKLAGYAKGWYEQQASYEISWSEWKEKLIQAFPFTKNKLSQIRDLVNRVRLPSEDPVSFYYSKLGLGMSCQLSDDVITEAVIGTLGDKLLEVGAKSAGCHDTTSLLRYLASINTSNEELEKPGFSQRKEGQSQNLKCYTFGKQGHKANRCRINKENRKININKDSKKCSFCNRSGHVESECYKKKNSNKYCSFCKINGHTIEECRKQSKTGPQNRLVRKVQTVSCDSSDRKYFKDVLVNGTTAKAYLDFGSLCNTMTQSFYERHNLDMTPNDSIVIKGYGDAIITPIGSVLASLIIDGVEKENQFYIVPDHVQEVDVLIGQTFTESPDLVVIKTPTELNIYENEMALQVTELCESLKKVCLYPETGVQLTPGINKVLVRLDPVVTNTLNIKHSEQRKPMNETDVLSDSVSPTDGHLIIKVINKTSTLIALKENECIARAEVTEQNLDETVNI